MCVIYFVRSDGKRPPLEELLAGEDVNGDGGGIAYFTDQYREDKKTGERIIVARGVPTWEKGLKAVEIHEKIQSIPGPLLIHFRMASVGEPIPELTHPFPVEPKASTALTGSCMNGLVMQNGTWTSWRSRGILDTIEKSGGGIRLPDRYPWSDTRVLAWIGAHYGLEWYDFADHNSKLGVVKKGAMYVLGDGWLTKEGWLQSSSTFKSTNSNSSKKFETSWEISTRLQKEAEEDARKAKGKEKQEIKVVTGTPPLPDIIRNVKSLNNIVHTMCKVQVDPVKHLTELEMAAALAVLEKEKLTVTRIE